MDSDKSTNDQLIRFETYIHNVIIKNYLVVSIFFDLEKAYDTTWRCEILKTGIKGNMAAFIKNFLSYQTFTVKHENASSDIHKHETGVPQGSNLSVAQFILKINSITESISRGIEKFQHVDDFTIAYSNMLTVERQLQNCLNMIEKWTNKNGFHFSKTKTVCIHFCKRRTYHFNPEININGHTIPVVQKSKYFGIIFDKKN